MPCALVQDGKIIGTWCTPPVSIFEKHRLMCKQLYGQSSFWGDHGRAIKRKLDPAYVAVRNGKPVRRLVVVNLDEAPANWLAELCLLYGWAQ